MSGSWRVVGPRCGGGLLAAGGRVGGLRSGARTRCWLVASRRGPSSVIGFRRSVGGRDHPAVGGRGGLASEDAFGVSRCDRAFGRDGRKTEVFGLTRCGRGRRRGFGGFRLFVVRAGGSSARVSLSRVLGALHRPFSRHRYGWRYRDQRSHPTLAPRSPPGGATRDGLCGVRTQLSRLWRGSSGANPGRAPGGNAPASAPEHRSREDTRAPTRGPCERSEEPLKSARLVVLVSGTGTLLQALLDATREPAYGAHVVAVGADRDGIEGLARAERAGVPTFVVKVNDFPSREDWDIALTEQVKAYEPTLVVSAGFRKLVGKHFLASFGGRYVNSHNSLLPSFPGLHGPRDALNYGVKVAGATLFLVDEGVDTGPIIAQVAVPVEDDDTEESLTERIKVAERQQLVDTIGAMVRLGFTVRGRKVTIP